jgi:hypothetical protein
MTELTTLLVFLAAATPSPGTAADEGARVKIQVMAIEAKPGSDRDVGVDPKLAAKLRATLKAMGMDKPDLTALGKDQQLLTEGQFMKLRAAPHEVKVICGRIAGGEVVVTTELYKKRSGELKLRSRSSKTLKADGEPHVVATGSKSTDKKKLFVVSREE